MLCTVRHLPRWLVFLLTVGLIAACSPRYDWREVGPEAGASHWIASFPGRTQTQTRTVKLDGVELNMTMTAARVDEVSFAVGEVEVSPTAVPEQIRDQMLQAMLRNVQAQSASPQSVNMARVAIAQAPLSAQAVAANGHIGTQAVHLAGRFVAVPAAAGARGRALQIIVLGPQEELSRAAGQQAIETFMTSLRLE